MINEKEKNRSFNTKKASLTPFATKKNNGTSALSIQKKKKTSYSFDAVEKNAPISNGFIKKNKSTNKKYEGSSNFGSNARDNNFHERNNKKKYQHESAQPIAGSKTSSPSLYSTHKSSMSDSTTFKKEYKTKRFPTNDKFSHHPYKKENDSSFQHEVESDNNKSQKFNQAKFNRSRFFEFDGEHKKKGPIRKKYSSQGDERYAKQNDVDGGKKRFFSLEKKNDEQKRFSNRAHAYGKLGDKKKTFSNQPHAYEKPRDEQKRFSNRAHAYEKPGDEKKIFSNQPYAYGKPRDEKKTFSNQPYAYGKLGDQKRKEKIITIDDNSDSFTHGAKNNDYKSFSKIGSVVSFPCRLEKYLAISGICSRRDVQNFIDAKRIHVNDELVTHPLLFLKRTDKVFLDHQLVSLDQEEKVWIYYKPRGMVVSHDDPQQRPTIFEHIKQTYPDLPRVIAVGRLDFNSEGLLLLTNSSRFATLAMAPNNGWSRFYKVRVFGDIQDSTQFEHLKNGCEIEGISYGPIVVEDVQIGQGNNHWLYITLKEGKNKEIRRIMDHFDLQVNRLLRIGYGPYVLDEVLAAGSCVQASLHTPPNQKISNSYSGE
jgi:23S rRNA pseudouridine2605 synthase